MGKKDILSKTFFSDCRRFAELVNIGFYQGRELVYPEHLIRIHRKYSFLSGEKERDILMKDRKWNICYGIELETEEDYSMPERVMTYDVCEYEEQIRELHRKHRSSQDYKKYPEWKSRMKENDVLIPVVTGVLYLGEGDWGGKRSLSQMFQIAGESQRGDILRIQDYTYPLMEADYEDPEVYRTDLREFFQAMQCRRDKGKLRALLQTENFQKLDPETQQVIAVYLNRKRLIQKMEKEGQPMCRAFDELMKEERKNGRKEGQREGRKEGQRSGRKKEKTLIIRRMLRAGMDEKVIRELTRCTEKELAEAGK